MKISETEKGTRQMGGDCPESLANRNVLLVGHDIIVEVFGSDRVLLEARLTKRSHDCPDGMVQIGSNKCAMLTTLSGETNVTEEQEGCAHPQLKLSPLVIGNEKEWKDTLNLLVNSHELNQQSGIILPRQAHRYRSLPIQLTLSSKLAERLPDQQISNISDPTTLDHPSAHVVGCLLLTEKATPRRAPMQTTTSDEGREDPTQAGNSFASLPQFLFLSRAQCRQRIWDSRERTKLISPGFTLCSTFHPSSPTLSVTDDETPQCDKDLLVEPGHVV
eukprot:TCALIF_00637-PA protein Name:"Protein of unknown function" AED:0.06 eAED:0.06 QI:10/1/0.5/1/1/0.75/4/0/274